MKRLLAALLFLTILLIPAILHKHRGEVLMEIQKGYEAKRAQSIRVIACKNYRFSACHRKRGK